MRTKNRIYPLLICVFVSMMLAACSGGQTPSFLSEYDYDDLTQFIKLGEYKGIEYEKTDPVSDTDVKAKIDEALLQNTFIEFQAETGITPALLTVMPDDWQSHYNDFSRFAYESYVNLFTDESHWLFCYSGDPSSEFDDWQWEGMQGNDTDRVLT